MMAAACGEVQSDQWSDLREPGSLMVLSGRQGTIKRELSIFGPHCFLDGQEPRLHELQEVGGDEISANPYFS